MHRNLISHPTYSHLPILGTHVHIWGRSCRVTCPSSCPCTCACSCTRTRSRRERDFRAGLRAGGALSRAKDNVFRVRTCFAPYSLLLTLAAALASPRAYPARLQPYSAVRRLRGRGRAWPVMVEWCRARSVRVFSLSLFHRVTIESRSICAEARSILFYHESSVEHARDIPKSFLVSFVSHPASHTRSGVSPPRREQQGVV